MSSETHFPPGSGPTKLKRTVVGALVALQVLSPLVATATTQYQQNYSVPGLVVTGSMPSGGATSGGSPLTLPIPTPVGVPELSLSSAAVVFDLTQLNSTSQVGVLVTNTGTLPLTNPVIATSGADYSATHNCATTFAAGASCTITVSYSPSSSTSVAGSLSVGFTEVSTQTTTLSGTASVDYSALLAAYVNPQVASCANGAWGSALGSWFSVTSQGCNGMVAGTFSLGKAVQITGNAAVRAKIRYLVDNSASNLRVNGVAVDAGGGAFGSATNSTAFTLYPGINAVTVDFTNSSGPGGWIVEVVDESATNVLSSTSGWKYSGTAQPLLTASPATQAFGNVAIGSTAQTTYTLSNLGDTASTLNFGGLPGTLTRAGTCASTLAVGATCTVVLTFAPTSTSLVSGSMVVSSATASATLAYSGTGVYVPGFALSTTAVAADNTMANATSQKSVIVTNNGNQVLSAPVISTTGTGYSATHDCAATLAVNATCTVTVTFAPTASGTYPGSLSVAFAGLSARTATLTGTGLGLPFAAVTGAGTLDFGPITTGASVAKTVTVQNTGDTAATGVYVTVAGTTLTSSVNTCGTLATPVPLAAGASCTLTVTFAPTAIGAITASTITVNGSFSNTGLVGTFTGSGVALTDANFASVKFLANFDSSVTAQVGTASTMSTSTAIGTGKFSNALVTISGSTRQIYAGSANYTMSGDFTVEGWFKFNSVPSNGYLWDIGSNGFYMHYLNGSFNTDTGLAGAYTLTPGTWYHVAETRSGTTRRLFVNGVQIASDTKAGTLASTSPLTVGNYGSGGYSFPGAIDEFRISNIARYTANFTPPTAGFPTN